MIDTKAATLLQEQYEFVFQEELMEEMANVGTYTRINEGDLLMDVGQYVVSMPLVLSGSVKIMREDKEGNELLLYYLERGDTCAMSFSCCMGNRKSKVRAVAEEDSELLMIPTDYIDKWLLKYPTWKAFVFDSFNGRIDELIETVDSVAFMKLDERLLKYLTDKAKVTGKTEISATHQDIAYDLHTSRVVISRLLKQLEKQGVIKLARNRIEVLKF